MSIKITDAMLDTFFAAALDGHTERTSAYEDTRVGLAAVLALIDLVPDHIMTITDRDGDEWHRATKYSEEWADPMVWLFDLDQTPRTAAYIDRKFGPITWEGKEA